MAELLTDEQINEALAGLPQWQREGEALTRTAKVPGFMDAIAAVNRIAEIAENANHHPDIDIRFNKLTFSCATHSKGGITQADASMAGEIDRALEALSG
jgi:4a-hydroxytetrahydrobiopterin dehydratase